MRLTHDLKCGRHWDRDAEWVIVSHYVDGSLLMAIRSDQILNGLCGECRLELLSWLTHPQEEA